MLFWSLALVLVTAVRIPYLTSPNFILDGDESILGLMAKHMSEGAGFPVFFYGQAYGFSLLETLPAAVAFRLIGPGPVVLALTMMGLYLVGLVFYQRAFLHLTGDREWSRWLTLMLALMPVWIVWSVKARGGYLSAFVLGGAALWLLSRPSVGRARGAVAGSLLGLLVHAQPFWFPGFLPFVFLPWARGEKASYLVPLVTAAAAVGGGLYLWGRTIEAYWQPSVYGGFAPGHVLLLPMYLHRLFSGFFYLLEIRDPSLLVSFLAWGGVGAFYVTLVISAVSFLRDGHRRSLLAALTLLGSASFLPFLRTVPPRYLLSTSVLVVIAVAIQMGVPSLSRRILVRIGLGALLLAMGVGAIQMRKYRALSPGTGSHVEADLRGLLAFLERNGVEGVYSMSGLLQWQIMFYGEERVPARYRSPVDRYPAYPARVDSVLARGGRTVLLGPIEMAGPLAASPLRSQMIRVGQDYFAIARPSRALLMQLGFGF